MAILCFIAFRNLNRRKARMIILILVVYILKSSPCVVDLVTIGFSATGFSIFLTIGKVSVVLGIIGLVSIPEKSGKSLCIALIYLTESRQCISALLSKPDGSNSICLMSIMQELIENKSTYS